MPTDAQPNRTTAPADHAARDADAGRVADAATSTWRRVEAALSRIIGKRGVAALYQRSLYLARADHPCLAAAHEGALQPGDFTALRTALAGQSSPNAATASQALLQTFRGLLANLIGDALTERLLKSVWDNPSSGHAAQDTSP